jgi:hypothetical protein
MPLVVRPMQAVIASPRRAPRSDSAAHAFLLPQTCFTRRLTADAGGAKGAGGRSEPANRAVSLRRYLNCGTSDATPTQTGRSVGVRGRGAAGHPCTPLPRRLRRCGTARCVSGHGRDGGLELCSVSLRSSSSEADLELPAEALLHCLDGATFSTGQPCCLEKLPSATPRILWPMLDLATVRRLGVTLGRPCRDADASRQRKS